MRIAKTIFICTLIAGVSIFGFIVFTNLCVALFEKWGLEVPDAAAQRQQVEYILDNFWWAFIILAVLPPIYEELFFRFAGVKLLQWVDTGKWRTVAVAVSAAAVSLAVVFFLNDWLLWAMLAGIIAAFCIKTHKNTGKLKNIYIILIIAFVFMVYHHSWAQTVYQFAMGVIFTVIYLKTKNILYTIFIHFINNAFIVIYTYYGDAGGNGEIAVNFGIAVLGAALAAAAVCMIYNLIKELPNEQKK